MSIMTKRKLWKILMPKVMREYFLYTPFRVKLTKFLTNKQTVLKESVHVIFDKANYFDEKGVHVYTEVIRLTTYSGDDQGEPISAKVGSKTTNQETLESNGTKMSNTKAEEHRDDPTHPYQEPSSSSIPETLEIQTSNWKHKSSHLV